MTVGRRQEEIGRQAWLSGNNGQYQGVERGACASTPGKIVSYDKPMSTAVATDSTTLMTEEDRTREQVTETMQEIIRETLAKTQQWMGHLKRWFSVC